MVFSIRCHIPSLYCHIILLSYSYPYPYVACANNDCYVCDSPTAVSMAARVDESHSLSPTSDVPYQPLSSRTSSNGSSSSGTGTTGGRPRGLSRTADGRSISFRNPAAILTRDDIIRSASTMKTLKPITNNRCRWNIPWLLFIWLVIAAPIWLVYAAGCSTAYYTTAGVFLWFDLLVYTCRRRATSFIGYSSCLFTYMVYSGSLPLCSPFTIYERSRTAWYYQCYHSSFIMHHHPISSSCLCYDIEH